MRYKITTLLVCIVLSLQLTAQTVDIATVKNVNSQTERRNSIGVHFATGSGVFASFGSFYSVPRFYTIGFNYSRTLTERLRLVSGLEYTRNNMLFASRDEDRTRIREHSTLTTIPVQLEIQFGRFFYLNTGVFFNVLGSMSSEAYVLARNDEYRATNNLGMLLGCGVGIGFRHEFDSNIVISLNPYLRWNGIGGIGSFYSAQITGFRFIQAGVAFRVGYRF